ncbi:metallophosphoesterase family protein [Thioflexithrix psekupsensis]|uniref:Calcineurin-like phosphoesterase domain-containing protein n=1 Tax=Thioflexithrix psekupsensis TaxID=1570016 RepID=A0A251X8T6_9GAMM|nr:metallophosphoesterase family protein [Thioflexithrix psekupsensis]OUD13942.1 hypothetical protein TPSD3_06255 [Thioflexithrix psekupsensis]
MSKKIELIGAVGGDSPYQIADIEPLLASENKALAHGQVFTGRVCTQIYTNETDLVKIRQEIKLDAYSAQRWAVQMLAKEQGYQIHHPHKTWFVQTDTEQSVALIGSICPHLRPLHTLIKVANPTEPLDYCLRHLERLFDLYFRVASEMNIRLDEGLSNFALTANDQLYYVDDDIYAWDRFVTCGQMLGIYFRALPWLRGKIAVNLGHILHDLMIKHFNDPQYLMVLAEQLRNIYLTAPEAQAALSDFIHTLKPKTIHFPAVTLTEQTAPTSPANKNNKENNGRYFALLADIHANLPALDTVLNFLAEQQVEEGIVLGDVVGYGPHPAACVSRLQNSPFIILKGNHDHALATGHFKKGFSSSAAWVLEWSMTRVDDAQKQWLNDLPSVWHGEGWMGVHGAPIDPTFFNAYVYEMTYHDNLNWLAEKKVTHCFHGHSHQPGAYLRSKRKEYRYIEPLLSLADFEHGLICPGSVGQPRNRQPGAQFAIYDRQEQVIRYYCLPYAVEPLIEEMADQRFPDTLIKLLLGQL